MKSFSVLCMVFCSCLVVSLHGAAVEPVVEELEMAAKPASEVVAETDLVTNEDCYQPKETGRCFALFYRFAYDVEKRECVEFIYGGCAGNSNNFETKEECEAKCMKKSQESDTPADSNVSAAPITDTTVVPEIVESTDSTTVPSVVVEEN